MNERVPVAALLPLRLLMGVILVLEGWDKLNADPSWLHGDALLSTLGRWLADDRPYAFFRPLIESARLHPKIFGTLVTLGELGVGASLLLGLLTRLGSFCGLLMLGSFALGNGQGVVPPGNAVVMAAVCLVFVFTAPGRVAGVDQALRGKIPAWLG